MLPEEVAHQIRLLEWRTDRIVAEIAGGAYRSIFKGRGIEFDEVREYTTDDDVRAIDWNVSARLGGPYVKKFVEERELTVMFLVDVSASGAFGSGGKSKRRTAAELAALLAFSAGRNGDRTGLMMFSDRIELYLPPRSGRVHALRMIREMLAFSPCRKGTDIALALKTASTMLKKRGIVFLISDLIDPEKFAEPLKTLRSKQDVIALRIEDPAERRWPVACPMLFEDAESGETVWFSGSAGALSNALEQAAGEQQAVCRAAHVDLVTVPAGGDVLKPVIEFFARRKERRRSRS